LLRSSLEVSTGEVEAAKAAEIASLEGFFAGVLEAFDADLDKARGIVSAQPEPEPEPVPKTVEVTPLADAPEDTRPTLPDATFGRKQRSFEATPEEDSFGF
jgi:hypothetical protein